MCASHWDRNDTQRRNESEGRPADRARSSSLITSIACDKMVLYGVHLQPEVELSPRDKMLHNLLLGIAGHAGNYTLRDRKSQCMQYIRNTVSDKKFLLLVNDVLDSVRSFVTEIFN